jgi:hypothetical protein
LLEAGDFVMRKRVPDVHAHVVLAQIGLIGNRAAFDLDAQHLIRAALSLLGQKLRLYYPAAHEVVIYEAARQPNESPRIERIRLDRIGDVQVSGISTLYVPPVSRAPLDEQMLAELSSLGRASIPATPAEGSAPAVFNQESS